MSMPMLIEKSINISLVYEEGNIFGCLLLMLITVVLYFILLFIKMNLQVVISMWDDRLIQGGHPCH